MANLTTENKVVLKKGSDPKPEKGYELVIYKKGSFDQLVREGEKPSLGWLDRRGSLEVYAVNCDPNLHLDFHEKITHSDQVHEFSLNVRMACKVVDSKVVVERLRSDPLAKVRNEAVAILRGYFIDARWESIKKQADFQVLVDRLPDALGRGGSGRLMDRLCDLARNYGLEVGNLDITRTLPEKMVIADVTRVNVETKIEVLDAEHELELRKKEKAAELHAMDRTEDQRDHFSGALNNAIRTVAENISGGVDSIEELVDLVEKGKGLLSTGGSGGALGTGSGTGVGRMHALQNGQDRTVLAVCFAYFSKLKMMNVPNATLNPLIACVFCFIGSQLHPIQGVSLEGVLASYSALELSSELREETAKLIKELKECIDLGSLI